MFKLFKIFNKVIKNMKKILIYNSGGGLGDSIQLFPLLISLINHYKKTKFFYLGAHPNHFKGKLKEYNIDLETVDLDLKYFGFRWWHLFFTKKRALDKNFSNFDLIIDLQTKLRNTLILKMIPHSLFFSKTFNGIFLTKKIGIIENNYLDNLNKFLNENIKKIEFKINRLPTQILKEAKKLLPDRNYIGFSITQGNLYRKKSWSVYKFVSLANKIVSKNLTPVFFYRER